MSVCFFKIDSIRSIGRCDQNIPKTQPLTFCSMKECLTLNQELLDIEKTKKEITVSFSYVL